MSLYTLTDPAGNLVAAYPLRGSAAREARARQKRGETVILAGPDLPERLYAPEHDAPTHARPYRVRCARCGQWRHDRPGRSLCAACWQGSDEQARVLVRARKRRWPAREKSS